jgi:hypothetical protein
MDEAGAPTTRGMDAPDIRNDRRERAYVLIVITREDLGSGDVPDRYVALTEDSFEVALRLHLRAAGARDRLPTPLALVQPTTAIRIPSGLAISSAEYVYIHPLRPRERTRTRARTRQLILHLIRRADTKQAETERQRRDRLMAGSTGRSATAANAVASRSLSKSTRAR